KRAGVGGSTMMTAQWAPWFDFRLAGRVPADAFDPKPSVDGGILTIDRCSTGSVPDRKRADYHRFVHAVFTGRGRGMKGILTKMSITDQRTLRMTMDRNDIRGNALPKDLTPDQWAGLYTELADAPAPENPRDRQNPRERQNPRQNPRAQQPQNAARKQKNSTKGHTMRNDNKGQRNDKSQKRNRDSALGPLPAVTGDIPAVAGSDGAAAKPVITGELPIVGAEQATEKLQASIPG